MRCVAACLSVLALALSAAQTQAQTDKTSLRLAVGAGWMMTHDSRHSYRNTPTFGADATLLWRTRGDEYWKQLWRHPSFGIKASFAAIPHGIAGHRLGLTGMLHFDLAPRWEGQLGAGLSAYTNPFCFSGDSNNIFIGSFINCLIDLGIAYHLTNRTSVALRLLHSSNGMLYRPNQGLNYLQLDLACTLGPKRAFHAEPPPGAPPMETHEVGLALSLGTVMSYNPKQEGYYPCYDLSLNWQRYLSPRFALGGTLDFWYNFTDRASVYRTHDLHNVPVYLSGLAFGEIFVGPLSLKAGIGPVILVSSSVGIPFYERVGLYYNFPARRHYLGIALNAHAGRIEFVEWTAGLRLR